MVQDTSAGPVLAFVRKLLLAYINSKINIFFLSPLFREGVLPRTNHLSEKEGLPIDKNTEDKYIDTLKRVPLRPPVMLWLTPTQSFRLAVTVTMPRPGKRARISQLANNAKMEQKLQ